MKHWHFYSSTKNSMNNDDQNGLLIMYIVGGKNIYIYIFCTIITDYEIWNKQLECQGGKVAKYREFFLNNIIFWFLYHKDLSKSTKNIHLKKWTKYTPISEVDRPVCGTV